MQVNKSAPQAHHTSLPTEKNDLELPDEGFIYVYISKPQKPTRVWEFHFQDVGITNNRGGLLLLFQCFPHWREVCFQKARCTRYLCRRCYSGQPPALSLPSQTCSLCTFNRKAGQVIIANKKPILQSTGSFSRKVEYHYSMNDSIIYSRAITCSDEAMLIG